MFTLMMLFEKYNQYKALTEYVAVKPYIAIFELTYRHEFDIKNFFTGNIDKIFESKDHSITNNFAPIFDVQCKIYTSLDALYEKTKVDAYGRIRDSIYLLESLYTEDEIKQLAARGLFSQAISKRYSYHTAFSEGGMKEVQGKIITVENKLKAISNPHVKANLEINAKPQASRVNPRLNVSHKSTQPPISNGPSKKARG